VTDGTDEPILTVLAGEAGSEATEVRSVATT
jgi:hypothetical protein